MIKFTIGSFQKTIVFYKACHGHIKTSYYLACCAETLVDVSDSLLHNNCLWHAAAYIC